MSVPVAPRLSYRLLDPDSGAVIVQDLAHLHQSVWNVLALQSGRPGSSTIGDFSLSLPAPGTVKFRANKGDYDALLDALNQGVAPKVEGYLSDHPSGTPAVSGVVTKPELPLDGSWALRGSDTLFWLQQSQMIPGEFFGSPVSGALPTQAVEIIQALTCTQEVVWDDDFANWSGGSSPPHNSGDYVNSNWTFTSSDPYDTEPALTANTTGATEAVILSNTSWGFLSQYAFCTISTRGTMQCGTPGSGLVASGMFVIMMADSPYNNGVELQVLMRQNGSGTYDVEAYIFSKSGGTYTLRSSNTGIFTSMPATFPFEVTISRHYSAGAATYNVFINGKDAGVATSGFGAVTGRIGMRFNVAAGGSPAVYVNGLQFRARTTGDAGLQWAPPRFAQGTLTDDGGRLPVQFFVTEQSHLDLIVMAMALKGSDFRKTPGAGAKADVVDYGPNLGTDYSFGVVFREGVNVLAAGTIVQTAGEVYSTDVKVNAIPGANSGGTVIWRKIGAAGDMALVDTVSDVGIYAFEFLRKYARAIQQRKASLLIATQIAVARTPELVGINNGLGPRELDYVRAVLPTYAIDDAVRIVGYQLDETKASMLYYLSNFPEGAFGGAALQRLQRSIDFLGTTYSNR